MTRSGVVIIVIIVIVVVVIVVVVVVTGAERRNVEQFLKSDLLQKRFILSKEDRTRSSRPTMRLL